MSGLNGYGSRDEFGDDLKPIPYPSKESVEKWERDQESEARNKWSQGFSWLPNGTITRRPND